MNYLDSISITEQGLRIRSLLPQSGIAPMRKEIIEGLTASRKRISSKFLYNQRGSELYEQITRLEEYYPTRTEKGILQRIAPDLMRSCAAYDIIELGPGDASKISLLLEASEDIDPLHYLPLDISESAIRKLGDELTRNYPHLEIDAWVLDFTSQFGLIQRERPALICFFGSTIGNFSRGQARDFMRKLAGDMKPGDRLLLGMDRIKNEKILHAAYNDKEGVTAAFNRNIIHAVNEILESRIREEDFKHLAYYCPEASRIEMYLEALSEVQIQSPFLEEEIRIGKGERIHTESSHKFDQSHLSDLADYSGLQIRAQYTDEREWFALVEFEKP